MARRWLWAIAVPAGRVWFWGGRYGLPVVVLWRVRGRWSIEVRGRRVRVSIR